MLYSPDLYAGVPYKRIQISGASMAVTDNEDSKGLEYAADYSANFTDRSIVDKAYVDASGGGSSDSSWTSIIVDTVRFSDTNTEIWEDGSSNLSFKDAVEGTLTLTDLNASGTGGWTRTGTDISPTVAGDDILLTPITEVISFDDDTYIYRSNASYENVAITTDGLLRFVFGRSGSYTDVNASYLDLVPSASDAVDLGSSTHSLRWQNLWISDAISQTPISHSLTDGAPTDAQIDSATGTTPSSAGSGYKRLILDSDGSKLMYIIISDGTNWQYFTGTIAL